MDIEDYNTFEFLKHFLNMCDNGEADKWLKKVLEEEKQKNEYKNRWQTAIRDLILRS